MNVYDFDETIFDGDSTLDFYKFCLCRHPLLLRYLPGQLWAALRYRCHLLPKLAFKEKFYSFLAGLPDTEAAVRSFWDANEGRMKSWYVRQQKDDDVIISASPDFLLREICTRRGIKHLLASEVDKQTGKCLGENCYGEEKVRRYRQAFPQGKIDEFYSDSLSDAPLALLAARAYMVEGCQIKDWQ